MELWWEGDEWSVDENVEWFGLLIRVRRSTSGVDEWSEVLCLSSSCLQQWYWGLTIVCLCICCLFGQWCSSEVINKNSREVVLIVLIIPIVELVALIIPVVYPITIFTVILIIIMVTLTIQLNTISTVTTVTLLIIQLWHFFYSSEGADAETSPTIPNYPVNQVCRDPQDSWIPVDISNRGGNVIVPTPVLQRIFAYYNHVIVIVIKSSVHKSLQWIG